MKAPRINIPVARPQSATCNSPPGRMTRWSSLAVRCLSCQERWWKNRLDTTRSKHASGYGKLKENP